MGQSRGSREAEWPVSQVPKALMEVQKKNQECDRARAESIRTVDHYPALGSVSAQQHSAVPCTKIGCTWTILERLGWAPWELSLALTRPNLAWKCLATWLSWLAPHDWRCGVLHVHACLKWHSPSRYPFLLLYSYIAKIYEKTSCNICYFRKIKIDHILYCSDHA